MAKSIESIQFKKILDDALDSRFAKLDKALDSRFAILDEVLDSRFAEADKKMETVLNTRFAEADKKMEQKFEEKLKPIHKKLNKLQKDIDLIARTTDRDITKTMHRVDKIEQHLGLPNPFSV
jgi:DNA anti-recombination protein RmuC